MQKIVLAVALLAFVPAAADAKSYTLGTDPAVATLALPDNWDVDSSDGQVEALSPDQTVFVSAEIVSAADLKAAGQEVARVLADQKIALKQDSRKVAPLSVAGMPGATISWDATDADGPTQVHMVTLKATPDSEVLILRWGDADAEKDHAAEIDAIVKSVMPVKDGAGKDAPAKDAPAKDAPAKGAAAKGAAGKDAPAK